MTKKLKKNLHLHIILNISGLMIRKKRKKVNKIKKIQTKMIKKKKNLKIKINYLI